MAPQPKRYHVRAFEFSTDSQSHDRVVTFAVTGLNTLPVAMAHQVGLPGAPSDWVKRLPGLRNSLSYHSGTFGIGKFSHEGRTWRVFIDRDARDAPKTFRIESTVFDGHDDPGDPIYGGRYGPGRLRSVVPIVVADLESRLGVPISLTLDEVTHYLRSRVYNKYPKSTLYFSAAGRAYTAVLTVSPADDAAAV